jgi:hypothetical protein
MIKIGVYNSGGGIVSILVYVPINIFKTVGRFQRNEMIFGIEEFHREIG